MLCGGEHAWHCLHVLGKNMPAYLQVCVQMERQTWGFRESTVRTYKASSQEKVELVHTRASAQ